MRPKRVGGKGHEGSGGWWPGHSVPAETQMGESRHSRKETNLGGRDNRPDGNFFFTVVTLICSPTYPRKKWSLAHQMPN